MLATLIFASLILAAVVQLGTAVTDSVRWANNSFGWRAAEYKALTRLSAGLDIRIFEDSLGSAVLRKRTVGGHLVESSFRGRDYWVQAVSDEDGTVVFYSVTSCDVSFRPTFEVPGEINGDSVKVPATLQKTRFGELGGGHRNVRLFMGATSNFQYHEGAGGGNPMNYQMFYVGLNDLCPPMTEEGFTLPLGLDADPVFQGFLSDAPFLTELRDQIVINTYGESAPSWGLAAHDRETAEEFLDDLLPTDIPLQLGVNRLDLRHIRLD